MSMKLLLFGKIGSGKSFVGELLQQEFGIFCHDADQDLPDSLVETIRLHQPITEKMRDEFVGLIIERICQLSQEHEDFCVVQALFKNRHRLILAREFPDLQMIWIQSPEPLLDARLEERTGHLATQYYARMVNPQFEVPAHPHRVLNNQGNLEGIRAHIAELLADLRRNKSVEGSCPAGVSPLPSIKALVFDLDGTLVDSAAIASRVMEAWCLKNKISFQLVLEAGQGSRTEDTVSRVAPHLCAQEEARQIELLESASLNSMSPVPGAPYLLNRLQSARWAIVTSSSMLTAKRKLGICNMPLPEVFITAESVKKGKPHPEPYLLSAQALGVAPDECLVFEDADNGVQSALSAGCRSLS